MKHIWIYGSSRVGKMTFIKTSFEDDVKKKAFLGCSKRDSIQALEEYYRDMKTLISEFNKVKTDYVLIKFQYEYNKNEGFSEFLNSSKVYNKAILICCRDLEKQAKRINERYGDKVTIENIKHCLRTDYKFLKSNFPQRDILLVKNDRRVYSVIDNEEFQCLIG
ncbi:MAG: hypothetical protein KAJ14_02375 [Candidatus Omnitrophica bacterium]|nr:hypothetical protein [Candidatus Omnitrophota bacterium]